MLSLKLYFQHLLFFSLQCVLAYPQPKNEEVSVRVIHVEPGEPLSLTSPNEKRDSLSLITPAQANALAIQNAERAKKGVKPLVWDDSLASQALIYAQTIAISGKFEYSVFSSRPDQSENAGQVPSPNDDPLAYFSTRWANFRERYAGQVIPLGNFVSYAPYTNLMWSGSERMGIAAAPTPDGKIWYVVARYSPAGNISGQKPFY